MNLNFVKKIFCKKFPRCTYINGKARISKNTTIGQFCSIARNVMIGAHNHPTNWLSSNPFQYSNKFKNFQMKNKYKFDNSQPTIIGNDVWIGTNVVIISGVKIGDGAIIAANAVVTRDVPPYAIVGGLPAKIIKYRFDKETIADLISLKWWELSDNDIRKLPFNDITKCIQQLKQENKKNRKKFPI